MAEEETIDLDGFLDQRVVAALETDAELNTAPDSWELFQRRFPCILSGLEAEARELLARFPLQALLIAGRAERFLAEHPDAEGWLLELARWQVRLVRDSNCT